MRWTPLRTWLIAAALLALAGPSPSHASWGIETVQQGGQLQNPTLAWGADGALRVLAQSGAPDGDVILWRHADGSWTPETVLDSDRWSSPHLALAGDDPRIAVERFSSDSGDPAVFVTRPGAGGWETEEVATGVPLADPRIVARDGALHLAWVQPRDHAINDVRYAFADAGESWTVEVVEEGTDGGADCDGGSCTSDGSKCALPTQCPDGIEPMARPLLMVADGGLAHLIYRKGDAVRHAVRDGESWTHETVATDPELGSAIAANIDAEGAVHVAWAAGEEEPLHYATNASGTWAAEEVANQPAVNGRHMDLLVDADGDPHVFFVGTQLGCTHQLKHARRVDGTWLVVPISCFAPAPVPPDRVSATLDPDGGLQVAFYDHATDLEERGLRVARRLPSEGADLSVTTQVEPADEAPTGGELSISALVYNDGPDSPVGARLDVNLTPAESVASLAVTPTSPGDTCSTEPGAVLCTLAGLTEGSTRIVLITAIVASDATGELTIDAEVTGTATTDPNPDDDRAPSKTLAVVPGSANVWVQVDGPESVTSPGSGAFEVRWANNGDLPAEDVAVLAGLPDHVHYESASGQPAWDPEQRRVTWGLGDVEPGEFGEFDLNVAVPSGLDDGATLTVDASIQTTTDQSADDDQDSATATITSGDPVEPTADAGSGDRAADASDAGGDAAPHQDVGSSGDAAPAADTGATDDGGPASGGGGGCVAGGGGGAPFVGTALVALFLYRRRRG